MIKLFHYVHCPFCIRVRMGFGLLNVPFKSIVLPYDDEKTPQELMGKKMLPIIQKINGQYQNESLDILKTEDPKNLLDWDKLSAHEKDILPLLDKIGQSVHPLAMPYWIWTPEFNESSRYYFQSKKEAKRGPFKELVKNRKSFITTLDLDLQTLITPNLSPFYKSDRLTIIDIMLAAHLWGMYIVPEYQFEHKIHQYLQRIKAETHFNYHEDFWL